MTNRVSSISRAVETWMSGDMVCGTEPDERLVGMDGGGGGRGRAMTSDQYYLYLLRRMTAGVCSSYRYMRVL
jgi:hypothetical protein